MNIHTYNFTLKSGHVLSVFFNEDTGLFVADMIHKNGRGGNEFVRMTIHPDKMVAFAENLPKVEE